MHVAVICDTHFGARNDNRVIQQHQEEFLVKRFFPALKKLKITHVLHLGDLVEKRKSIDFVTLKFMRESFLEPLRDLNISLDVVCGNHDTYFKTTNDTNALSELLVGYDVVVHTQAAEVSYDHNNVLLIPWITPENHDHTMSMIKDTKAKTAFGHLALDGFEYFRGLVATHGLPAKIFEDFDKVWSGHYHQPSSQDNIHYLGAPYEMTWADAGCPRGFGIWSSTSNKMQVVPNPRTIFERIEYSDDITEVPDVKNKFVRLSIASCSNTVAFDMFRADIEDQNVADLKVDDIPVLIDTDQIDIDAKDTQSIMIDAVNSLQREDVDEIRTLMVDIYKEATYVVAE
jgi:DNA repair exonuclease SbcCD nuclease subunit